MSIAKWLKAGSVLLVVGATGSGARLLAREQNAGARSQPRGSVKAARADDMPVHMVTPGRLSVTVVERGIVEASRTAGAYCRVQGGATILWILPDGTMVPEDQLVCELDSSDLEERFANQIIAEQMAAANHQNARLKRENAEIARIAYTKGNVKTDQNTLKKLRADVEKHRTEERAKRLNWQIEKSKVTKLFDQIASCMIIASGYGLLVHANDPNRRVGQPIIEVGATVRERQKIFSILDIAGPMQVNAKVRESVIDQIDRGTKARIRVDAFPGELLTGVVVEVSPLPDATPFFRGAIKTYTTRIRIDKGPKAVRPGMTAQVEILVADRDNVLTVPVQSVHRFDDKDHVAVQKSDGAFEWRAVNLGLSNDQLVEVKQGIQTGEIVALDPLDLLRKPEKRGAHSSPNEPGTEPRRPR